MSVNRKVTVPEGRACDVWSMDLNGDVFYLISYIPGAQISSDLKADVLFRDHQSTSDGNPHSNAQFKVCFFSSSCLKNGRLRLEPETGASQWISKMNNENW